MAGGIWRNSSAKLTAGRPVPKPQEKKQEAGWFDYEELRRLIEKLEESEGGAEKGS
jgi:hypothetical protein